MSLRELPPDQAINPSRWRHLRYVPLTILVIASVVSLVTGFFVARMEPNAVAPVPTETDAPGALPDSCHPAVVPPQLRPWQGDAAAASELTWQSHADDLKSPYVLGQDDWVFWGDIQANNFSQAIGRRYLSPEELTTWHTYLANVNDALTAQGIPFYIVVAPAKWAVYPDELPKWAQELRGPGPLDQLVEASGDLPLIDLRSPMQAASAQTQTFSRLNSHWSDFGAYTGWNAIADCVAQTDPTFAALAPLPVTGVSTTEFNEYADYGLTAPEPDWTVPQFASPLQPVEMAVAGGDAASVDPTHRTALTEMPATTSTPGAQVDASVLWVGDSFGSILSPYLAQAFTKTFQVRHNFDGDPATQPDIPTLSSAYRPDVVILEIAQRHLNFPPKL